MHICNKIVRKFTFKCDFMANGLYSAMMQPTHSEIYNSSISATLRTLSFCFSIKQPIRITDSFSFDYADCYFQVYLFNCLPMLFFEDLSHLPAVLPVTTPILYRQCPVLSLKFACVPVKSLPVFPSEVCLFFRQKFACFSVRSVKQDSSVQRALYRVDKRWISGGQYVLFLARGFSREHIPAFTPYTLHFTPYSTGRLGARTARCSGSR